MKKSALFIFILFSPTLQAATLTYPSAAPCDTTLQLCIDGAATDDTIEIATNERINEEITIAKSLEITSADGYQATIGSATWLFPREILIEDSGTGDLVDVTLDHLNLDNARLYVSFSADDGQNFTLQNSTLTNVSDNNNDYGIELSLRVASTVLIQNNTLASSGSVINIDISMADPATADITIVGNTLTGSDPLYSYQGIQFYNAYQGTTTLDIQNNLIYNVGSCFCGGPAGVDFDQAGDGVVVANIINNTIWQVQGEGAGLVVATPSALGTLTVNLHNNSITDAVGYDVYLPAASALFVLNNDYNNFFNNSIAGVWGGYTAGANTLSEDPLYFDTNALDFRLQNDSPLINAGTNDITDVTLATSDFQGATRIVGGAVDIGAYEANSDFSITATAVNSEVTAGEEGTILFVVQNNGPDADVGTVAVTLTSGDIDFVSISSGSCANTDTTVSCTLGELSDDENATLVVTTLTDTVAALDVTASVTGNRPDSDTTNNSATTSVTVTGASTTTGDDDDDTDTDDDAAPSTNAESGGGGCALNATRASQAVSLTQILASLMCCGFYLLRKQKQSAR